MEQSKLLTAQVVLHADDLGMNRAVTDGIVAGFTSGLLTSTSVLANAPDFDHATKRWRWLEEERASGRLASAAKRWQLQDSCNASFDLGVHLNLTQGRPLTSGYPADLLDAEERFPGIGRLFQKLILGVRHWRDAIQSELAAQIARVIDSGFTPTHLNGHQYVELVPGISELIPELAHRFQISVVRVALERRLSNSFRHSPRPFSNWCLALVKHGFAQRFRKRALRYDLAHTDGFCGTAHAGHVSLDILRRFVIGLPRGRCLEIGLHPGVEPNEIKLHETDDGWQDPLAMLRPHELAMLESDQIVELFDSANLRLGRLTSLRTSTTPQQQSLNSCG